MLLINGCRLPWFHFVAGGDAGRRTEDIGREDIRAL
jgi:hypothetical protein